LEKSYFLTNLKNEVTDEKIKNHLENKVQCKITKFFKKTFGIVFSNSIMLSKFKWLTYIVMRTLKVNEGQGSTQLLEGPMTRASTNH